MKVICNKSDECNNNSCVHSGEHTKDFNFNNEFSCYSHAKFNNCIKDSKCIEVKSENKENKSLEQYNYVYVKENDTYVKQIFMAYCESGDIIYYNVILDSYHRTKYYKVPIKEEYTPFTFKDNLLGRWIKKKDSNDEHILITRQNNIGINANDKFISYENLLKNYEFCDVLITNDITCGHIK